jgi:hypothetical protein
VVRNFGNEYIEDIRKSVAMRRPISRRRRGDY